MKKEELRIGNWYHSIRFGTDVQCDLSDLYDLCAKSDGAVDHPPIHQIFKPIPLTEEWLIKFGLDKDWMPKIGDKWTFKIEDDNGHYYSFNRSGIKIEYVHQIQNLWHSLTGEELVIN